MATHETAPLPQFYGQQLTDGTIMESPRPVNRAQSSSESRRELLRLPMQPHPAHMDQNMDQNSPPAGVEPSSGISVRSNRRLGGHPDFNDYGSPTTNRFATRRSTDNRPYPGPQSSRYPYVEDYASEDEYEMQPYRRPQPRQRRNPPLSYENDARGNHRYNVIQGRNSIEAYSSYNNDKPRTHMHYGSDDEYNNERPRRPHRPHLHHGGHHNNGNGPPTRPPSKEEVMRLPWIIWMGSNAKNHFVAFVGEFVGTTMFLFFAFSGTQVANIGSAASSGSESNTTTGEATGFSPNVLLYIALVFSFSLMVNVWVFFRISGGLFNPAVTFAMLLCRAMSLTRAALLVAAQLAGSIFSSYLVSVMFPTDFNVRTTLSTGTSLAQGVFIEAVLTAELVFTIFMLAKEKHKGMLHPPLAYFQNVVDTNISQQHSSRQSVSASRSSLLNSSACTTPVALSILHAVSDHASSLAYSTKSTGSTGPDRPLVLFSPSCSTSSSRSSNTKLRTPDRMMTIKMRKSRRRRIRRLLRSQDNRSRASELKGIGL
jgi:aquaporin related protein